LSKYFSSANEKRNKEKIDISNDGHDDLTIVIFGDVDGSVFEASNSLIEDNGSVFPV